MRLFGGACGPSVEYRIGGVASALAPEKELDLAFIAGIDAAKRYNQVQAIARCC